jgi:hypothetical protein
MPWQYRKISLNELPRRTDDMDLLCHIGREGWELVHITPNNIAYFKREFHDATRELAMNGHGDAEERCPEVKAKYRDPVTGDTWAGRGRMARWLKIKQDTGEDIEKYRVSAH